MTMIHQAHLEGTDATGYRVVCTCGWRSEAMGDGDAYTTKMRGLEDKGHAAYARRTP